MPTSGQRVLHGTLGAFTASGRLGLDGKLKLSQSERCILFRGLTLHENGNVVSSLLLARGAAMRENLLSAQKADAPLLHAALILRSQGLSEPAIQLRLINRGNPTEEVRAVGALLSKYRLDSLGVILYDDHKSGEMVWIPRGGKLADPFGVEKPWRESLTMRAHLESAHGGVTATYHALRNLGVYWDSMWSQCEKLCASCLLCTLSESRSLVKPPRGYERYFGFGRIWSIDHIGPFVPDDKGNKYILSIRDHGTGFPWFVPVGDKACQTAANQILEIGGMFGYPLTIKTDMGFGDGGPDSLQKYVAAHNIMCVSSLPYHPTSNTWVEGIHKPLRRCLEKYANLYGKKRWSEVINTFAYMLRTTPVPSLGNRSPYELMFGRLPRKGVLEVLSGFGGTGTIERGLEASVEFREELQRGAAVASMEQNQRARARDKIAGTFTQALLPGSLVVIRNKSRIKSEFGFINFPVLFLIKTSGSRWVTLTDLAGRDGTGRAAGKIPIEMVVPVLNPADAKTFVDQFGGNPPSTEEMLGSLADAFKAGREDPVPAAQGQN